jgi:hypothetical protein
MLNKLRVRKAGRSAILRDWHAALASSGGAESLGCFAASIFPQAFMVSEPLGRHPRQLLRQPDFFADFDTTIFPILNPNSQEGSSPRRSASRLRSLISGLHRMAGTF